ncbi:hypothetical protein CQY20_02975 [Mycolicibacterium agri]|uniref:CoA transferase n=2 Tax=Mycolicibacterium agri TaxID=36811 RepID=A0A2A7NFX8_MYCAG|nr:hypothetical protein CQY20_02975 [Mycolicibacterium agri]GFG51243.1 CoA transferase [Mycolicibacterium agri]
MAWAGPLAVRVLAEHGAEVIKIEGAGHMDRWRGGTSPQRGTDRYPDNDPGDVPWNRNAFFNTQNQNKQSLALDLKSAQGRDIFRRLVATADLVMENFGAGAMGRLGLDYPDLVRIKPDLSMVSMPAFGRTGPESSYVAHGPTIEAAAGNVALQGYPGGPPSPSGVLAWGDPVAGITGGVAALVALTYQRITGCGTHVDLSHLEAAIPFNFQAFLEFSVNGVERKRLGNTEGGGILQGCYPCSGDNQWVAITCPDRETWVRLAEIVDLVESSSRSIDHQIRAWTAARNRDEVVRRLRDAGIPVGPVLSAADLLADPHLNARGFFRTVTHPQAGTHRYPGMPWLPANRPWRPPTPAPLFGEHNESVLTSLLDLSPNEVERLYSEGVIAHRPLAQGD